MIDYKAMCEASCANYNNLNGSLIGSDCPMCRNKGFIAYPHHDEASDYWGMMVKYCECWDERKQLNE